MNLITFLLLDAILNPPPPALQATVGVIDIDQVYLGYAEAALWSTLDERDNEFEHLDATCTISDICRVTADSMWEDCEKFVAQNYDDLVASKLDDHDIGHTFWLNRNGHGDGFWDRNLPGDLGKKLDHACESWGEVNLFVNANGEVDEM